MAPAYDPADNCSAKYRDMISNAVSRLPSPAPALRRELYERARAALQKQLRRQDPPLAESAIAEEERALNEAIEVVEARAEGRASGDTQAELDSGYQRLTELLKRAAAQVLAQKPASPPPVADVETQRPEAPAEARAPQRQQFVPRLVSERKSAGEAGSSAPLSPAPREEAARVVLRKLQNSPGVEAGAVIAADGSIIASALSSGMEEARIARMAATLNSIGANAATALARGAAREVIIHGKDGYAVLISAGGAFLLALTNDSNRLGAIFSNIYDAVKALDALVQRQAADPAAEPRASA